MPCASVPFRVGPACRLPRRPGVPTRAPRERPGRWWAGGDAAGSCASTQSVPASWAANLRGSGGGPCCDSSPAVTADGPSSDSAPQKGVHMPQHAQPDQPEQQSHSLPRSARRGEDVAPAVLHRLVAGVDGAAGADHALDRDLLIQTHGPSAVPAAVTIEAVL